MAEAIISSVQFVRGFAPDGSYIGIVDFDSVAIINSNLRKVATSADRENIVAYLPVEADVGGGTCLECGVLKAVEMLSNHSEDIAGSKILILTDGQGSWSPSAEDAVIDNGIEFSTIFFGVATGNDFLSSLSVKSGGNWNFATDLEDLLESFVQFGEVNNGDVGKKRFQIQNENFSVDKNGFNGSVSIDSTIGNNTQFVFTYTGTYVPYIVLKDPSGIKYCSIKLNDSSCALLGEIDEEFTTITFKIPLLATIGTWLYNLESSSPFYSSEVTLSVSSMVADKSVEPIKLQSWISKADLTDPSSAVVVYARVTQGFSPILFANVTATISFPDGSSTTFNLFDRGAAPDIRTHDGVYSRYFTGASSVGRYSLKVRVSNNKNNSNSLSTVTSAVTASGAAFNCGTVLQNGTIQINKNCVNNESISGIPKSLNVQFERSKSGEGFEQENATTGADIYPPSKIIDLIASQVNLNNLTHGFRLSFSAPGDDYDNGTATSYEISYSYNNFSQLLTNFSTSSNIGADSILSGDLSAPKEAGEEEIVVVSLQDIPELVNNVVKVWFAVRAIDESGNAGEVSNIALVNVFFQPPAPKPSCLKVDGSLDDDSIYYNPSICKYFACIKGTFEEIVCKDGMRYELTKARCEWASEKCEGNITNNNYIKQEISCTCKANPVVVTTTPLPPPTTPVQEECPSGISLTFIPDAFDCTTYYQCFNGIKQTRKCFSGFVFDPEFSICNSKQFTKPPCGTRSW